MWFEPSNAINMTGIHEYDSEENLIKDLKIRFLANGFLNEFFNKENDLTKIFCCEYAKPKYHIRGSEFYNHCRSERKINITI